MRTYYMCICVQCTRWLQIQLFPSALISLSIKCQLNETVCFLFIAPILLLSFFLLLSSCYTFVHASRFDVFNIMFANRDATHTHIAKQIPVTKINHHTQNMQFLLACYYYCLICWCCCHHSSMHVRYKKNHTFYKLHINAYEWKEREKRTENTTKQLKSSE